MKNVYFLSDAHLGSLAIPHQRMQERRLVRFLDSIKEKAAAIYLLGDMFDFWYEYKYVVPKGYTRFLGKVSELTDSGVEVHYFTGNHDIWLRDYFERECGMTVHRVPITTEIYGKLFYLGHGDGLDAADKKYLALRALFHSRVAQFLFSALHPRWAIWLGMEWARHSRLKRGDDGDWAYRGESEPTALFAREYLKTHPEINYFIFGHRHAEADVQLSDTARLLIAGDWFSKFTYITFDGDSLTMRNYVEGESKP